MIARDSEIEVVELSESVVKGISTITSMQIDMLENYKTEVRERLEKEIAETDEAIAKLKAELKELREKETKQNG